MRTEEHTTIEEAQKKQVEKIGVVFEKSGLSPVGSRIIGLLMVGEPPYKTFDQIVETVGASKSTVSNTIKFLQTEGLIDYITFSGDRKRYFQLNTYTWVEMLKRRLKGITPIREVMKETANMRSDQYPQFNQDLLNICELYGEFEKRVLTIIEEWEKNKSS